MNKLTPQKEYTEEEMFKIVYTSKDILEIFTRILEDKRFKKANKQKSFTFLETHLLADYLFKKPLGWEIKPFPLLEEAPSDEPREYESIIENVIKEGSI